MDDATLSLLLDLHLSGARQGPGEDAATLRALALSGLEDRPGLRLADIGCGTGAATRALARALPSARITAVDVLAPFLERLAEEAEAEGLADRIETLEASMDALPFEDAAFDAIWAEGAIYNMGFAAGLAAWRRFLKPRGVLAVSEITWLTPDRPEALTRHWDAEYPEIDLASAKIAALEAAGYVLLGYFPLARRAWMEEYYGPLRARLPGFLARHPGESAAALAAAEEAEIALYEAHVDEVSYGFYVARRAD